MQRLAAFALASSLLILNCAPTAALDKDQPLTGAIQKGIASGKKSFSHQAFDRLLKKYVSDKGLVNYAGIKSEAAQLEGYLDSLAQADLTQYGKAELKALLINAYNAYTLDLIVRNYPIASIKRLPKPWDQEFCRVGGHKVSLNFIEHNVLRVPELFGDPRVHFGVNCASIGCPPLRNRAFTGKGVEKELEEVTRNTLKRDDYLTLKDGRVYTTKILDWFKGDFERSKGSVAKFLIPYASPEAAEVLKKRGDSAISYFDYDWKLNKS